MRTATTCLWIGLIGLGCSEAEVPLGGSLERQVGLCRADFEVEVTTGPEAGFKKTGKLTLVPTGPSLAGFLESDGDTIAVVGSEGGQQLMLAFTLPDGRKIVGVGPTPATPCTGRTEGVAVGPSLDPSYSVAGPATSSGHWLASNFQLETVTYSIDYDTGLTSSDFDFPNNASVQMDCDLGPERPRFSITCRDGKDPVRDAIANFLGVPYCSEVGAICASKGGSIVTPET